jgi:tetratricopeptide (TPR) repeat protein
MTRTLPCWVLVGLLGACGVPKADSPPVIPLAEQVARARAAGFAPLDDGTAAMAARLEALADSTDRFPNINAQASSARVARLIANGPPQDPQERFYWRVNLSQELLHVGQVEEGIAMLEDIFETYAEAAPPAERLALKDYLAIAYLRLAQVQNCIRERVIDGCVWPITASYDDLAATRKAIALYREILAEDPADLNSLWMLNVASMMEGSYPDGVPEPLRLPVTATVPETDFPRFVDRAPSAGVDVEGLSGSVVMDDFDGDGLLDLMVSSSGLRNQLRMFVNAGDGTFRDVTKEAGLTGLVGGLILWQADYDNDGDPDVFISRGAWQYHGFPNSLLRNNGDGTFSDVTVAAGLGQENPSHMMAWADFDADGWLDLFVGNETSRESGNRPSQLFRNQGDGTFVDVAGEVGMDIRAFVKGAHWGDIDNDGRPDLYISNLSEPNMLFHNEGPGADGGYHFREVAGTAGVRDFSDSFPPWFWDYDNDGDEDLFVNGWRATTGDVASEYLGRPFRAETPRLYRNRGDGTFDDVTVAAGLNKVMYTMGTNFGDLDGDGFFDFYVGTGDPDFRAMMPNRMFRGVGGERFEEVTIAGGFGHLAKGHGAGFGDIDHDGDQDVYIVLGGAFEGDVFRNVLLENPGPPKHWITLRLEGVTSNRSAIGARIHVRLAGGRSLYRTVRSGGSFGASPLRQFFGLGDATAIESIDIWWPTSDVRQHFENTAVDGHYAVREDADAPVLLELPGFVFAR